MKKNNDSETKQYIYIAQASKELASCKIGKTNDLERRLKDYNSRTGKSKDNVYSYLFSCEVENSTQLEKDIKEKFLDHRQDKSKEMYFFNESFFEKYVNFIKSHKLFVQEIFLKKEEKLTVKEKIVKRTAPSLKERGLTHKDIMQRAKRVKNDEFYTRKKDVEKELSEYDESIWKDKVVFCNCDDAIDETDEKRSSAFAWYFYKNFEKLGLKKLICTHYSGTVDLFNSGAKAYIAYIYTLTKNGSGEPKVEKTVYKKSEYNGSFDHPISLKILKEEADIVCTNPPFSRARDFWKIIIDSGKKFIFISNVASILTTFYVPYFKNKLIWPGYYDVYWYEDQNRVEKRAGGFWFTNFPIKDRPKYKNLKIIPLKNIPEELDKPIEKRSKFFDDSKVLVVNNGYIPSDYKKPFAISTNPVLNGILEKGYEMVQDKEYYPYNNGKKLYSRILIQKI